MTAHRVDQTILADDLKRMGNCLPACVASFLGVPLDEIPHFLEFGQRWQDQLDCELGADETHWWAMFLGFMAGRGLWPTELDDVDAAPGELLFVMGMSPRGVAHQVLYRDGALWHDPHPSRAGVIDVREVIAWRPAKHDHTPTERTT